MKHDDTFANDGASSTSFPERGGSSDEHELATIQIAHKASTSPNPVPQLERRSKSHRRMRFLLVAMVGVTLVALTGGYGVFRLVSQSSRPISSTFQQIHCPFPLGKGLSEGKDVRCGFLVVPEDRNHVPGPTIRLAVAIFKTPSATPAPDPVLMLGGGPGNALLENQGPTYTADNLASRLGNRDLIVLEQRGTGYSQPSLRCLDNEDLRACHDRLLKSGINLNAFTTLEDAADVHDLIQSLGYQQVNLEGTSYGSRLALTVMRQYPADLRSVVLDSVIPSQVNFFTSMAPSVQRAFDVLFHGCALDSQCHANYPNLQTVFYQDVADLNHRPATFETTSPTGKNLTIHFTGNDLVLWVRQSLTFTWFIPPLPAVLFQIRQHNYTQLAQIYANNSINSTMSEGLFYSIECGEDMAFVTQHDLEASAQALPQEIRPGLLDPTLLNYSVCQFWGMKPVPAIQKEPVRSSIPTLILQGEYDPVTPPANGMLVAQTLSKAFVFLFPGVGHGVLDSRIGNCPNDIMNAFLTNPAEKPDGSCVSIMTEPFFT